VKWLNGPNDVPPGNPSDHTPTKVPGYEKKKGRNKMEKDRHSAFFIKGGGSWLGQRRSAAGGVANDLNMKMSVSKTE